MAACSVGGVALAGGGVCEQSEVIDIATAAAQSAAQRNFLFMKFLWLPGRKCVNCLVTKVAEV